MTPGSRRDTPTHASAVTVARRFLSSAVRSSEDSDWPVNSLILSFHDFTVFLCDDYHPPFPVVWFSPTCHVYRHGQTTITCDAWRFKNNISRRPAGTSTCCHMYQLSCVLGMIRQASFCSTCFQRLKIHFFGCAELHQNCRSDVVITKFEEIGDIPQPNGLWGA